MATKNSSWRLVEGGVDLTAEHFEISLSGDPELVARVGRRDEKEFVVEFLDSAEVGAYGPARAKVRGDLRFHLVEKGERDPWDSARQRSRSAGAPKSEVHWSWVPSGRSRMGSRRRI
jgi:hypothetical protein